MNPVNNDLTYSNAIEQVMLRNGYFAPLKLIYSEIWKYKDKSKVKGKTPDYTIQAIVQRDPRYTKIGLGVYALTDYLDKLPKESEPATKTAQKEKRHAAAQGMLIEIGNVRSYDTYTTIKNGFFRTSS